jgi:hypothetical protein
MVHVIQTKHTCSVLFEFPQLGNGIDMEADAAGTSMTASVIS